MAGRRLVRAAAIIETVVLVGLDACLVPVTAVASAMLTGYVAGWILEGSGVSFYRSQQPDELAAWSSLFFGGLAAVLLVLCHTIIHIDRGLFVARRRFWISALCFLRDHLIVILLVSGLVLLFTFLGGIPQTGRALGG